MNRGKLLSKFSGGTHKFVIFDPSTNKGKPLSKFLGEMRQSVIFDLVGKGNASI